MIKLSSRMIGFFAMIAQKPSKMAKFTIRVINVKTICFVQIAMT